MNPAPGENPSIMQPPLTIDGGPLSIADVERVARDGAAVTLGDAAHAKLEQAHAVVANAANGDEAVYGVNTGFGSFARIRIDADGVREVQRNLIRSHAAGVGDVLPCDVVRATMLLLAASLCRGHSGVRVAVVRQIIELLNHSIVPVVPSRGSVGASGDLAPLSHIALVLIGEGTASVNGHEMPGDAALRSAGLEPIELHAKEGLALINGTHMMAAMAALGLCDIQRIFDAALVASAMAIDGCEATDVFLDERLHAARPHPGQAAVAAELRRLLEGSTILTSHREDDPRVQDPYCLRATPQVLGAVLDTINHVRNVVSRELTSVTDNPLVFPDDNADAILSGGNFHGMPLAVALDSLAIALCHLAGISERRVYWLLKASDGVNPVNPYLSPEPGLHSGLMITQYTAAACCNELQTLATPASVANIPTSAGIEDYNSMGATAAHQATAGIRLARYVIAIELLVMSEAMEYQRPLRSGTLVEQAFTMLREVIQRLDADRPPSPDIEVIDALIGRGRFDPLVGNQHWASA